jgi:alpha-L-rhamnosidase
MKALFILLISICIFNKNCQVRNHPDIEIIQTKCNNQINPMGTGNNPLFSWTANSVKTCKSQSAYRIIVASDQKNIDNGKGDLWDSGKKLSDQSVWISYNGKNLDPCKHYYWRVRIWDNNDNQSPWSDPAFFVTGLFDRKDWDGAKWIGYEDIPDLLRLVPGVHGNGDNLGNVAKKRSVVPYFRKEYSADRKIRKALVFVAGLGQYELYMNGEKIGDRFLSPGWTDYNKTFLYNIFDVTSNIKNGTNAIGVLVGNGFFNINRERYRKLVIAYGAPQMILKLEIDYEDGSRKIIVSDETWKTSPSPVTFSSIYGGEDYDARLEQQNWNFAGFNDSGWNKVVIVRGPAGNPEPENDYPVKIMQQFNPAKILKPKSSIYVYDYGQNASGIIKLKIKGKAGQEVKLIPGELIDDDSQVNQKASGSPYYFSYILKGNSDEIWMPRFTYYGFRYVQVEGAVPLKYDNPDNLPVIQELQFLHSRNSSPEVGSFRCSNDLFNSIYDLINWAIKSNMASVATDCPHREKLGWLEQTHLMGNSIKYIYDVHNLYSKIIDDMIEAQLDNGLVPDIAPEFVPFAGGFRDSPEWGSAAVILPWDMYSWYGDIEAVRKAYPMMKKYLAYLKDISSDNILSHGLGDWYDLGPKSPGEAQLTPKSLTATSIYFYDNKLMAEMAALTGNNNDAIYYRNMAEEIRNVFNKKFFNNSTKVYSTGSQTSYSMPLFFGMVDEKYKNDVTSNLVRSIRENNNALTAGDVGYRYLIRALEGSGNSQLIYDMNSKTDVPGYGYQISKGATSLTESWAALKYVSNNHMMLGHLMEWFYSGLGGIRQTETSFGYQEILIDPEPVGSVTWAETVYNSIHGEIKCFWRITDAELTINVTIPFNCKATIIIPGEKPEKITEGMNSITSSEYVKNIEVISNKTRFNIQSGSYEFKTPYVNDQNHEKK